MSATPRKEVILIAIINIIEDFKGHTHTPKLDHIMSVRMCVCMYVDGDVCNLPCLYIVIERKLFTYAWV